MNLKPAVKYNISNIRKSILIYYSIFCFLMLSIIILSTVLNDGNTQVQSNGTELSSMIFLFIMALNSYKNNFNFFLANGLSRKTQFVSFMIIISAASLFMTTIDSIIGLILPLYINSISIFDEIYWQSSFVNGLIWKFFAYLSIAASGYMITTLYYKMNKPMKLIISIGVPGLFFVILPIIDAAFFEARIAAWFIDSFNSVMGIETGEPYIGVLSMTIFILIISGFSFLLARRSVIKE